MKFKNFGRSKATITQVLARLVLNADHNHPRIFLMIQIKMRPFQIALQGLELQVRTAGFSNPLCSHTEKKEKKGHFVNYVKSTITKSSTMNKNISFM